MRWLTSDAKGRVLAEWERKQVEMPRTGHDGVQGGSGGVDSAMIGATAVLNGMDGVVTLQSCEGHRVPATDGSGTITYPGQVWLWLSEERSRAVYAEMDVLLNLWRGIEPPRVLWQPNGQEVLDVRWPVEENPLSVCHRIAHGLHYTLGHQRRLSAPR